MQIVLSETAFKAIDKTIVQDAYGNTFSAVEK